MQKFALVFVFGVITPSLVLAWLAVRSLKDEQLAAEQQQSLLYQGAADGLARDVNAALEGIRRDFHDQVEAILRKREPLQVAPEFDELIRKMWPLAELGFAVTLDGQVLTPSPFAGPVARRFRLENDRFLSGRETLVVYWNSPKGTIKLPEFEKKDSKVATGEDIQESKTAGMPSSEQAPQGQADFRQIVEGANDGVFARFLEDRLKVFFWYRSPFDSNFIFGAQVNMSGLADRLHSAVRVDRGLTNEIGVALLNDLGQAVARHPDGLRIVRSKVAASREVSDALPHWQAAVYPTDPARLGQTARTLRLVLGLIIGVMVLAIGVGSWLIAADLRRQLTLARQKTDFVSNVSHELKTPLTSIRLFSEMLAQGRVMDEDKRVRFLNIITAEASRLTRLINNVLEFGRVERDEARYEFNHIDLGELVRETVESYRPHLESLGFKVECEVPGCSVPVQGDRDALAQVFLNLLSNAEKYSGDSKDIAVTVRNGDGWVEASVLDRGIGVPPGCEEKIFEQFFRAHDSLTVTVPGSGLGLTLARGVAAVHKGELRFRRREGAGSCFSLRLPCESRVEAPTPEMTTRS